MSNPKKLKKSESLEIRIPYPTKLAFMEKCRADGNAASVVLRTLIERDLEKKPALSRRAWRLAAGALIATAVGAAALPTLARPSPTDEFRRLDADHNGQLSLGEYQRQAGPLGFRSAP